MQTSRRPWQQDYQESRLRRWSCADCREKAIKRWATCSPSLQHRLGAHEILIELKHNSINLFWCSAFWLSKQQAAVTIGIHLFQFYRGTERYSDQLCQPIGCLSRRNGFPKQEAARFPKQPHQLHRKVRQVRHFQLISLRQEALHFQSDGTSW